MALFPHESLEDVCDNLTGAIPELGDLAPAKSALHGVRAWLGPEAMRSVFEQVAASATEPSAGRRWRGLRFERGQEPDRLAVVDPVFDQAHDHAAGFAVSVAPVEPHAYQRGAVRQGFDHLARDVHGRAHHQVRPVFAVGLPA